MVLSNILPMKRIILGLTIISVAASALYAQDEFDDIYYNPKAKSKSATEANQNKKKSNKSNYIANFSEMDVDAYNNRGFYYESDVDTIGAAVEAAEDFVYTQQIQKYYNPTIVLDNADVLADVLENSYGNVEIVIKNNVPVFSSIYYGDYGWAPGYYNWTYRPAWSWGYAWGPFSVSWNYGPYWAWDYWPAWSLGPSWAWGPGYRPWYPPRPHYHGHRPYYAYHRPGAYRPVNPGSGWSSRHPSANRPHASASRPTRQPGGGRTPALRPGSTSVKNDRFQASDRRVTNNRRGSATQATTATTPNGNSTINGNKTTTTSGRSQTATRRSTAETVNRTRTSDYRRSTNTNSSTIKSTTTRNTNRSYNSGSSGRSYNSGARSSGGGSSRGGGSHGGGRGGRR